MGFHFYTECDHIGSCIADHPDVRHKGKCFTCAKELLLPVPTQLDRIEQKLDEVRRG